MMEYEDGNRVRVSGPMAKRGSRVLLTLMMMIWKVRTVNVFGSPDPRPNEARWVLLTPVMMIWKGILRKSTLMWTG